MASRTTASAAVAERYATAVYDLAETDKALDHVAGDLRALAAMIGKSDPLRRLIRSPLIGREAQGRAMDAILEKAKAHDLTRRFVGVVAGNRRLFAIDAVIAAFLALLAKRRGEVTAEVTSARKLSAAQMKSLATALKKAVGAKVGVTHHVDPELIGGLLVKVGSRMVDSSLRTKLQKLELAMKGIA